MSVEDIREKEIKNIWLLGLGASGFLFAICGKEITSVPYFARFIPGAVCLLLAYVTREQIGMGDALVLLVMGWYLEFVDLLNVCVFAFSAAGLLALILLTFRKRSGKQELAFVPFLLLGYLCLKFLEV